MRRTVVASFLLVMLGCDRPATPDEPAPPGLASVGRGAEISEAARRLATFKEGEEGKPCPAYAIGAEIPYGGFVFRFEPPILATPEVRLPWIRNDVERAALGGKSVLVVPLSLKNTAPVAKSPPEGILLATRDGRTHHSWTYNEKVWTKNNGRRVAWELGQVRPDEWVRTAYVYDADPAELAGAVLYLHRIGDVRDRSGYSHRVVYEQAVTDLPAAVPGDPIRGM